MSEFRNVALISAHPPIPALLNHGISDLTDLCSLAAYIRESVDEVAIPVGPTDREPLAGFESFMRRRKPDLVGISTFTCGARSALEYAEIAREHGAFVVAGGYHPSALPDEMLASPFVDAVVRGEGEETLQELVEDGPSDRVQGLSFKDGDRVVHNTDRPVIEDLDALPMPLRSVRPPRFGLDGLHYHVDTVFSSRGCKARCVFCANHLVGKQWRRRSNEHVLRELSEITPNRSDDPKLVKLWDANFMGDTELTAELCEMIIENGFHRRFRFMAETRIEDIVRSKDILTLLREAGFYQLGSGIESPNPETLRHLRKGIQLDGIYEASRLLAQAKIHFVKYFIIGHPNETLSDILDYADFAVTEGVNQQSAIFFALTPYPGTKTFEDYRENDLIDSYNWDFYTNYGAVIRPNGISRLTLQALVGTLATQYSLRKRFARGESLGQLASKLFGLLIAVAKVLQLYGSHSDAELKQCLFDAVGMLRDLPPRKAAPKSRNRMPAGIALRFHSANMRAVDVVFERDLSEERVTVEEPSDASTERRRTYHLSVPLIYRFASILDLRRDGHDIITLRRRPLSMRISWCLSVARLLVRAGWLLGTMGAFHIRQRLFGERRR